jgi:hypothetical protein
MTSERLEFGSSPYFARVLEFWYEIFTENAAATADLVFSESYEYLCAPASLAGQGETVGFHFRWNKGRFSGAAAPASDCLITFHVDFEIAKMVWTAPMKEPEHEFIDPRVKAALEQARSDGRFVRVDKAPIPRWFYPVHNRIAELT